MEITYIGHSGFLAETEHVLLLFDYYQGELPVLSEDKALYVFASHRHRDHFNPEVFGLTRQHPQVSYIFSRDIWHSRVPEEVQANLVSLKPRQEWQDERIRVFTLKSTDEGVAFLVEADGMTVYHAGDLNDWRWEEEPEGWNRQMQENYRKNLEPLRGQKIDAAFVPLDPRQEKDYCLGMDYFLETACAEKVFPMHCWEDYGIIDRWFAEHPDSPLRERVVKISRRGEVFSLQRIKAAQKQGKKIEKMNETTIRRICRDEISVCSL